MRLEHSFTIPVGVEQAWNTLIDLERIAPCLPGARIESVEGKVFHGAVTIKVGPISLTYRGTAELKDEDPVGQSAVVLARSREARGSGSANATISAQLRETSSGDRTVVDVVTDLDISGKAAQFGTGVLTEVGNRLLDQFAARLGTEMSKHPLSTVTTDSPAAAPTAAAGTSPSPEPSSSSANVLSLAAVPILKRLAAPVVGAAVVLLGVQYWRRRQA